MRAKVAAHCEYVRSVTHVIPFVVCSYYAIHNTQVNRGVNIFSEIFLRSVSVAGVARDIGMRHKCRAAPLGAFRG
mgnify:CR=1 FL=1